MIGPHAHSSPGIAHMLLKESIAFHGFDCDDTCGREYHIVKRRMASGVNLARGPQHYLG